MKKSWDVIKVSKIQQLMVKYQCKVISIENLFGNTLDENKQHIATSQLLYVEIQFTGFYMIQAFTRGSLRKDFKTAVVLGVIVVVTHILGMVSVLIMYVSLKSKVCSSYLLYQWQLRYF